MNPSGGRLWRIAHSEFSLGWGGQEHRVLAELTGFRDLGCEVHLIAPVTSCIHDRAQAVDIPVVELPTSKPALIASVFRIANWLRRNRIQILNTHSSRDGWFVAIAGRMAGVPLIIRSRHIDVGYATPVISRHAFTTLADHVLCTSEQIRNHLQRIFQISDERITTLPTGIDPSRFRPEGDGFPGLDGRGKKLVGMISVLRSWKGHGVFMDAARRLLDGGFNGDFVITGEGPMKGHIEEWIAESGHVGRFHLLGHTEKVPEVLRSLDVLVIPSLRHEGIPQIGLQALASQTPIVGSKVGGIPEIVRDGETGRIVPPDDAAALAAAIKTTLAEIKITRSMTAAGRQLVEDRYSFSLMLDQLDQLYARHLED